ncbi:hypothetical protein NQU17_11750 [Clostridiaceae bacterium HFYG-1003]|nr:hypothetical protein NQU17_11750 [Clostridiaceae bacterium HFYG-1003]
MDFRSSAKARSKVKARPAEKEKCRMVGRHPGSGIQRVLRDPIQAAPA